MLEEWLLSYRPAEHFDENGTLRGELQELAPKGVRRMGANLHANGGLLLKNFKMPNFGEICSLENSIMIYTHASINVLAII